MNVQIQSVKFDADKKLIEFVENKMSKLERFADRATGAEVILKLDKDFEKGNKVATITLHMPGEDMVAEHRARAFEEAIDEAIDALKRQIEKFKEKVKKLHGGTLATGGIFDEDSSRSHFPNPHRRLPQRYLYYMKFLPPAKRPIPCRSEGGGNPSATFFRQNVQPADFLFIFSSKTFLKRSMFSNRTAQNWWWRSLVLSKQ
mgnify:CR=1 FL=1